MNILRKFVKALLGPMGASFYKDNRAEVDKTNFRLLRTASIFSTSMCAFLFAMTLINDMISQLSFFYFGYMVFYAVFTFLVLAVVSKSRKLLQPFFYVFATSIFALSIYVGTVVTPELPAVTFYVFLLIIPILFVTRPLDAVLLSIIACAAMCITTTLVKGPGTYLANTDILNAVCCTIVGIGFDITIINLHLTNILGKSHFRRQSSIDGLTGLPNRRSFDVYLEGIIGMSKGSFDDVVIFMMDIDDFKLYNDTYGHVQGDECLKRVGQVLEETADVHNIFLARFGGEEFVAVAVSRNEEELRKTAQRFVSCVSELGIQNIGTYDGKITISVGYAGLKETNARDYRKLLDCADNALYVAKAKGKNCAVRWDNSRSQ